MARPELSFDGKGINGPDEYRSRVATFQNAEAADKYGPLFASAPELLEALEHAVAVLDEAEKDGEFTIAQAQSILFRARAAIRKAKGKES